MNELCIVTSTMIDLLLESYSGPSLAFGEGPGPALRRVQPCRAGLALRQLAHDLLRVLRRFVHRRDVIRVLLCPRSSARTLPFPRRLRVSRAGRAALRRNHILARVRS